MTRQWYEAGLGLDCQENLRYLKPQATEFKAIIGMNAHALLDWFAIRCCRNAQHEIRDLAWKMLRLCRRAAPACLKARAPTAMRWGIAENNLQNALQAGSSPGRSAGRAGSGARKDENQGYYRQRKAGGTDLERRHAGSCAPSDSEFEEE